MYGFIIGAIILIIIFYRRYITVNSGDYSWKLADYHNSKEAAALLTAVHARTMKVLKHIRLKYCVGGTECTAQSSDVALLADSLLTNYNPQVFYENDPRFSNDTSYTLNKGSRVYVCLRDKLKPGELVDEDTLLFVMLHECAHMANYNGWGHTDRFWAVFAWLLREAEESGEYHPVDYSKYPVHYCSLAIEYNPLFDPSIMVLK